MTTKCPHCDALIKENKQLRKERTEEHRNYVEVINENLALCRELEQCRREAQHIIDGWEDEGGR